MKMRWLLGMGVLAIACGGSENTPAAPTGDPPAAQQLVIPPMDAGAASALVIVDAGPTSPPPMDQADNNLPSAVDAYTLARDPRAKAPVRSNAGVIAELQDLENQLKNMPSTHPGRSAVLRKIADGYGELGRNSGVGTQAGNKALFSSITYWKTLKTDYPSYASLDEALYFLGLAYEQANQQPNARVAYYDLIKRSPTSKYIPCAYYAFGEMFFNDGPQDPSKYDLAKQAFRETLKYPPATNTCYALAKAKLAAIPTGKP